MTKGQEIKSKENSSQLFLSKIAFADYSPTLKK
jgi:hypothetical protein